MSIVDAIQRAKQQGRKAATSEVLRPVAETPAELEIPRVSRDPVGEVAVARPAVPIERVQFAELEFDLAMCAEKHIAVPGVEEMMLQSALPPYRMLRARMLHLCRSNHWSALAITSPGPAEGKSVTSLNLAISIAKEGNHDVFLIDLDMRNPSICRYLGVKLNHELSAFFSGKASAQDVLFTVGIDRLTLAGCVSGTQHASELLATNHLEQLLGYIRSVSANPLILIDLPPVVITDDALVVIPRVDATVLVVSEGYTKRDGLSRAVSLLSDYTVAGIVLNRTNESIGAEYYRAAGGDG
jgi:capsular exopolysaccharide synthesis family protein